LDFEKPSDAAPMAADPEDRLARLGAHAILDEAQKLPEIFPILRSLVDTARKQNGRFVLLGSASPSLIRHISESLAGRTAFIEMSPFRWSEVENQVRGATLESLWYRGGFPDAFLDANDRRRLDWLEGYTKTYLERDLASWGIEVSPPLMRRFWTLLAHHHGGLWNASEIGNALGISYHTVNRYSEILEQTFLLRKLPPYHVNLGKRMVKSPKVYLRDSGLLHYFLGIHTPTILDAHPRRGASWEGFAIEHVISAFAKEFPGSQAYFWRTAAGAEADLLIDAGGRLIPFEIKLHSSPKRDDVRGLRACIEDLKIAKGYVIYPGNVRYSLGDKVEAIPASTLFSRKFNITALIKNSST
jgi:uncharacterized protein